MNVVFLTIYNFVSRNFVLPVPGVSPLRTLVALNRLARLIRATTYITGLVRVLRRSSKANIVKINRRARGTILDNMRVTPCIKSVLTKTTYLVLARPYLIVLAGPAHRDHIVYTHTTFVTR